MSGIFLILLCMAVYTSAAPAADGEQSFVPGIFLSLDTLKDLQSRAQGTAFPNTQQFIDNVNQVNPNSQNSPVQNAPNSLDPSLKVSFASNQAGLPEPVPDQDLTIDNVNNFNQPKQYVPQFENSQFNGQIPNQVVQPNQVTGNSVPQPIYATIQPSPTQPNFLTNNPANVGKSPFVVNPINVAPDLPFQSNTVYALVPVNNGANVAPNSNTNTYLVPVQQLQATGQVPLVTSNQRR